MKKLIVPFLLVLLPVMLMAGIFEGRDLYGYEHPLLSSRAWRLTEQIISASDGAQWIPQTRVHPFYNTAHPAQVDSLHMDAWDYENSEWMPAAMVAYLEYNAAGRIVSNVINMNFFGMMFPMMMETATYDSQNRITHLYMYFADPEGPVYWVPSMRLHLIYGTGTSLQVYGWEEGDNEERLPHYFHSTFTNDAQGRITEELSYTSPDSTIWVQNYRDNYQYHAQDTTTGAEIIEHISTYLPMMLFNDGYLFPGKFTAINSHSWNGAVWEPQSRATLLYNAQVLNTERLDEYYSGGIWYPEYKKLYYYDANGQQSYTIGQFHDGMNFVNDERYDYTWEQYGSANDDPAIPAPRLSLSAYPSPFANELTILPTSDSKGNLL
ncbi:MAG: hypothetical protein U1B83_03595, partial [Candidatus Cloacimonadaceae bacterium]|nr:hypothetical protein [Candidatus Cloacimonadaceae bacterium]